MMPKIVLYHGDLLIKTYLKLWQRIIFIVKVLQRIFSPIEPELSNANMNSLAVAGFKVIRDSINP
jgi:hypothetical protein